MAKLAKQHNSYKVSQNYYPILPFYHQVEPLTQFPHFLGLLIQVSSQPTRNLQKAPNLTNHIKALFEQPASLSLWQTRVQNKSLKFFWYILFFWSMPEVATPKFRAHHTTQWQLYDSGRINLPHSAPCIQKLEPLCLYSSTQRHKLSGTSGGQGSEQHPGKGMGISNPSSQSLTIPVSIL